MSVGEGGADGGIFDPGFHAGKERQPAVSRISEEKAEKDFNIPQDVIKRAVDAAIAHLERLTKSFP